MNDPFQVDDSDHTASWNLKTLWQEYSDDLLRGLVVSIFGWIATIRFLETRTGAAAPLRGADRTLVTAVWLLVAVALARLFATMKRWPRVKALASLVPFAAIGLSVLIGILGGGLWAPTDGPRTAQATPPTYRGVDGAPDILATARNYLVKGNTEDEGFGLYSYILFGSRPSTARRENYIALIGAYLHMIGEVREYLRLSGPTLRQINLTMLPVLMRPEPTDDAESILRRYDYVTAATMLGKFQLPRQDGIYIISTTARLSTLQKIKGKYLFQDLTRVPPRVVDAWVEQFMIQASQQQYWQPNAMDKFALDLRTRIAQVADITPDLKSAITLFWAK
jgi:hypothetical protein